MTQQDELSPSDRDRLFEAKRTHKAGLDQSKAIINQAIERATYTQPKKPTREGD